jgi:2-polyprenyl-3-methyl-5-hydroxy-6-metoxy-1,4-benzoquinol methylase
MCGGTSTRRRYRLTCGDIWRCTGCTLIFLSPLPSPAEVRRIFAELYATGEGLVPELRSYYQFTFDESPSNPLVQQYTGWLDLIARHHAPGTLADVGCGTGLFLATARKRGWQPFGVDDDARATDHARTHFGLEVETADFGEFADRGRRFDAVTMWDVIEHTRDPIALLTAARRAVAPGGILALATPNVRNILDVVGGAAYRLSGGRIRRPLETFHVLLHFLYFTPATLQAALERAGFAVVLLQQESTDLRRVTMPAPVRLAVRGLFEVARRTGLENRLFALATARE